MSGLPAALWLLGLFVAAPMLRTGERYEFADRLRDALILGIAIPFALGLVHALYPIACWVALAICVAIGSRRGVGSSDAPPLLDRPPYVLVFALVAVAWPQLMRPLLDGDSLSYHLPNAVSWVQAHSLWTTATRYWWYPPASELFASALYAVGGPFALPWSGVGALALLGFRICSLARQARAPAALADALAAATVTAYPLAIQGATLQNDVWLAAFWLESLALLRTSSESKTASRAIAVTALIKPQGPVLAAIALCASRARREVWLAAAGALALWALHDGLLWNGALVAPASTAYGNTIGSTILAHGAPALGLLARVCVTVSPFALLALTAALLAPAILRRPEQFGWAAFGAALLFFVLPFGYQSSVAQLATGASLRFAAPAIAAGALILLHLLRRVVRVATASLLASTLFGVAYVLAIFWNDGSTHVALLVAALIVAAAATARLRRVAWPNAVAFGLAVIASTHLAARHPVDYYADALRVGGTTSGLYRWIATQRPAAVGGWGLRLGVVNVLSPTTQTLDLIDAAPCVQARRYHVLLVAVEQNDRSAASNAQRLRTARACGRVRYEDPIAVVVSPGASGPSALLRVSSLELIQGAMK